MSLKDKLYNTEATPPANSWDKIATALDEAHLNDKFPASLYSLEINVPSGNWDKIASALNKETPSEKYPGRMYDLEIVPPFNAWNKIVSGLDPVLVEKPATRTIPLFLRYAAAAIFIGFAAFAIIRFTTRSNNAGLADQDKPKIPGTPSTANTISGAAKDAIENIPQVRIDTVVSSNSIATGERPVKKYRNSGLPSESKARYASQVNNGQSQRQYAYEEHLPKKADRYFMLLTPNGNFIRMSKKWSSLLCCVSGEEQDPDCKDQLQKWQEKIADSPITPGPGNFMDILSLVSSLNEGTEL